MSLGPFKIAVLSLVCILWFNTATHAEEAFDQRHIEVSMRMIGHQVLLNSGDSTSLVLPIQQENDQYRIRFESDFAINPDDLVNTVNQIMKETDIAQAYIVEVVKCETNEVVYSFERGDLESTDITPCLSRGLPVSCYSLLITLNEKNESESLLHPAPIPSDRSNLGTGEGLILLLLLLTLMAGVYFVFRKRRNMLVMDPNVIPLGDYRFDKRNTELLFENQRIELTSKEADILILLYNAVNTTVEREVLLNKVWGDEGDYVGRTLDVFISRLRKKLGFDSTVKIVNIRGIGYKLVMNG